MVSDHKILIVEDEEGIGLHLAFQLKRLGYVPSGPVVSGEQAVEQVGTICPSLVLMDISLAGRMSGIEAARIIRDRYSLPVIFLTGMSGDETIREAKFTSPYAFLVKPIEEKELKAALELALYKHDLEKRLLESEERYRLLFERMVGGLALFEILYDDQHRPSDYRFLAVNPALSAMVGLPPSDLVGKLPRDTTPFFDHILYNKAHSVVESGEAVQFELHIDETDCYYEVRLYLAQRDQIASLIYDVTERVRAKKTLEESELRFRQLAEGVSEVFWLRSGENAQILYVSPTYERVWGRPCQELYDHPQAFLDAILPEDVDRVRLAQKDMENGGIPFNEEFRIVRPDGSVRWIWARTFPVYDENGEVVRYSGIAEDITERKLSEQQLIDSVLLAEKRSLRMSVLHNIDRAITTHTELQAMIQSVLDSINQLAEVGAALIFRPAYNNAADSLILEGEAGLDRQKIRLLEMEWMQRIAADVYQSGKPILINRLESQPNLGTAQLVLDFGFVGCYILPLISKGQKKGVLVLMMRFPDSLDDDFVGYIESLALQSAIAIDNVELFLSLRRSHNQLSEAYDATIKGWAQALELRDKETRGHSERVISLATMLANELGLPEAELVHFQRGVLLHDIGKMAIPDNILLKPGPLTEEEWVLMRQHPVYAFEMLSEIDYLAPALDVPYCHHEKWDGSGYPRALKEEEIPATARMFTIVDTWDALTSGRPYHPPWSKQDALAYIARQAGKQFDPHMVTVFLKMMSEAPEP